MMKYSTYSWDLVWVHKPPAEHQPHLLIPSAKTINQERKNLEMRFSSQQIVLYCLGLRTQTPGLRELYLELSPKTCSESRKMLKTP